MDTVKIQHCKCCKCTDFTWNASINRIILKIQHCKCRECTNFTWNGSIKSIVKKVQHCKFRKCLDFTSNGCIKRIGIKIQLNILSSKLLLMKLHQQRHYRQLRHSWFFQMSCLDSCVSLIILNAPTCALLYKLSIRSFVAILSSDSWLMLLSWWTKSLYF
jgi:hypothetical protein